MAILDFIALLLAVGGVILAAPAMLLLVEVVASYLPARVHEETAPARPLRSAILVPAHDESMVIEHTLRAIAPELSADDRLIVIADNCTDGTASIAERAGAEVICRTDPEFRGKGYALDFGIRHLAADPPDVVIVVDADCIPAPGSLRQIAATCLARQRPVQARYDLEVPASEGANYLQVASLAWEVKNFVRPLGLKRLGLPCQLMGTGMAFPWSAISQIDLRTGNIVEDLALGLDLAAAGTAPIFHPTARVSSRFPVSREGQQTQRARWETGHLRMIWGHIPHLMVRGIRQANRDLIILAADAAVPPLTFLCLSIAAIFALCAVVAALGGSLAPLAIAALAGCAVALSVFLGARHVGGNTSLLKGLGLIPVYAISKLALYASAIAGKRIAWIRSKRD